MNIPDFKPCENFLGETGLPCLLAKVKNSEFPGIGARYISRWKDDPVCKIYLRSKTPDKITPWQQEMLEKLFTQDGIRDAVTEAMKECEQKLGEQLQFAVAKEEQSRVKKTGLLPHVVLHCILLDESRKRVLMQADAPMGILNEHGITIYLKDGRWRYEDGGCFEYYEEKYRAAADDATRKKTMARWESMFPLPPEDAPLESDLTPILGEWSYNLAETVKVLKQYGATQREINEVRSPKYFANKYRHMFTCSNYKLEREMSIALDREIVRFERKGMFYQLWRNDRPDWPESFWCDGYRLSQLHDISVYTRDEKS